MVKEFTISKMDPGVTTVRGTSTDTLYLYKKHDKWVYQESMFGEDVTISWAGLLSREGTVVEVPFASVGSIVHATELDRLPVMTVVRGTTNDMVYTKITTTDLAYSEGDQLVRLPISQLRNKFKVEWIDEGGEV